MKNKIKNRQFFSLAAVLISTKLFFIYPHYILRISAGQAWISCLIVTAEMLIIECLIECVMRSGTGIEAISNKAVRAIAGVILSIGFFVNAALAMYPFRDSVSLILIGETTDNLIPLLALAAAVIGAYCGIESISRICGLYFPIVLVAAAAVVLLLTPRYDVYNMLPREDWGKILIEGSMSVSMFCDVIAAHMISGIAESPRDAAKSIKRAVLVSGITAAVICLCYSLRVNTEEARTQISPMYQMARLINVGKILERMEALFELVWIIQALLYISAYTAIIAQIWSKAFSMKDEGVLILPAALVLWYPLSAHIKLYDFVKISAPVYIWVFAAELLTLVLTAFWRVKRDKERL